MADTRPSLIVIAGPTAVGKTDIAIRVALQLDTEILSADSRQCYQGMVIGTAQPTPEELVQVPHHFINDQPITECITAADYELIALKHLEDIFSRRQTAVLCGGTGLYIRALCDGLDEMPATDPQIVQEVNDTYQHKGLSWLQERVEEEDPLFFSSGETSNPARLLRALSFVRSSGSSILRYRTGHKKERPFRIIKTALELPRELLYERINRRVELMMEAGLEAEVRRLLPYRHGKNLNTVGYSELFNYLDGRCSLEEARTLIAQHSRNYAKRQLTWLRKDPEFHWFRADDPGVVQQIVDLL